MGVLYSSLRAFARGCDGHLAQVAPCTSGDCNQSSSQEKQRIFWEAFCQIASSRWHKNSRTLDWEAELTEVNVNGYKAASCHIDSNRLSSVAKSGSIRGALQQTVNGLSHELNRHIHEYRDACHSLTLTKGTQLRMY